MNQCECYVGSDFIGRRVDYEMMKQGLNSNPYPSWLQEMIKMRGGVPKIEDVEPCLKKGIYQLEYHAEEKLWLCHECFRKVKDYIKKIKINA
jgi:hypothetical protein